MEILTLSLNTSNILFLYLLESKFVSSYFTKFLHNEFYLHFHNLQLLLHNQMKILDLDIKLLITIKFLEHIYSCLKQEDYIFPIKRCLEKYKLLIMK